MVKLVKKTAYNRAFKVYWDKPQTDAVFTYLAPPQDEPDPNTMDGQVEDITSQLDATVIEQHATPSTEEQQQQPSGDLPFQANVNENTGEVYPTEEVKSKESKSTRQKRPPII